MTYSAAKDLHNADEVLIKKTGAVKTVICTEVEDKTVLVTCDDGNVYTHREIM